MRKCPDTKILVLLNDIIKASFKIKEDNMRKVELSLKEKEKHEIIKKLVETNGNKERARIKLKLKSISLDVFILAKKFKLMLVCTYGLVILKLLYMLL